MNHTKSHRYSHIATILKYLLIILALSSLFSIANFNIISIVRAEKVFYSIHVGSFKEIDNAKEMVDSLKKLGHNAFYRHETIKGKGKLYRIYIEKYESREEAEKEAEVLRKLELISGYIVVRAIGEKAQTGVPIRKDNTKGYFLQVHSYKEKKNAEKMVDNLKKLGRNASYQYETVKGKGKWYRVYIEGFLSIQEAKKEAIRLKELGLISSYTIKRTGKSTHAGSPGSKRGPKTYFLHVNSFKEKINAEKNVEILKKYGHKTFLVAEDVSGETWFRVYIGDFDDEKAALKLPNILHSRLWLRHQWNYILLFPG